jgi:hypothetical protein
MAGLLADQIGNAIEEVDGLYHRLVLLVAPHGNGKTDALREVAARTGVPLVNVNLELSRRLLDLTQRQRAVQASSILSRIAKDANGPGALLDNTELLFDRSLQLDPLRTLQGLSRHRVIVATWNGTVRDSLLTYAEPGHPDYRRYPVEALTIVTPEPPEPRHQSAG